MTRNPQSTAKIAGHPIHPMLIPFPIASFVGAFVSDLAFWNTGNEFWATASLWLLGVGLIMAALAAVAGSIDLFGDNRVLKLGAAHIHAGGNVVVVLIELYNWYTRYANGNGVIVPTGLLLSFLSVALLLVTGWMGWKLVYEHRVGISDDGAVSPESVGVASDRGGVVRDIRR